VSSNRSLNLSSKSDIEISRLEADFGPAGANLLLLDNSVISVPEAPNPLAPATATIELPALGWDSVLIILTETGIYLSPSQRCYHDNRTD
tara:strand:+ start:1150 stop:1419 length:270 start_codon:yes stop_codon:yes gene_type:complete